MKTRIVFLCCLSIFIVGFGKQSNAQEFTVKTTLQPYEAVSLANQQLTSMLELMEPTELQAYGFSSNDDFSKISIGAPFYVTNLAANATAAKSIQANVTSIQLPLLLNNQARCFIYLALEQGQWKAVGIGGANEVAMRQDVFNVTSEEATSGRYLVSIPQLSEMYVLQYVNETPVFKSVSNLNSPDLDFTSLTQLSDQAIGEARNLEQIQTK